MVRSSSIYEKLTKPLETTVGLETIHNRLFEAFVKKDHVLELKLLKRRVTILGFASVSDQQRIATLELLLEDNLERLASINYILARATQFDKKYIRDIKNTRVEILHELGFRAQNNRVAELKTRM